LVVHAFDQTETLLGQGTIGIELENEAARIDTLLVPVGGLIGGIAAWYAGETKVIGVEPEASPTLSRALEAGRQVDAEAGASPRTCSPRPASANSSSRSRSVTSTESRLYRTTPSDKPKPPSGRSSESLPSRAAPQPSRHCLPAAISHQRGSASVFFVSGGNTTAVDFTR
jgi:threonine dehydratase